MNGRKIIHNVSLAVPKGSIYTIIGPNGAGKTTLLRLMTGVLTLDEGTVRYAGEGSRVSVMLENDYLFEAKTGRENLRDFAIYLSLDPAQVSLTIDRFSALLKLDSALDHKVAAYSKGMKRKLSLLITLLRNTSVLILDELTSGIDPESRRVMSSVLSLLKDEGRTVILTSHDLAEVQKISDWITVLNNGTIVETMNNREFHGDLEQRFFDLLEGI